MAECLSRVKPPHRFFRETSASLGLFFLLTSRLERCNKGVRTGKADRGVNSSRALSHGQNPLRGRGNATDSRRDLLSRPSQSSAQT